MNIFKRNRVALTDRTEKTKYVKKDKVDNYVLTAHGWLVKDKKYHMHYASGKEFIAGWEIHLKEIRLCEYLEQQNTPEEIAKRKAYMETPQMKTKIHESIMCDLEHYGLSEETKQEQIRAYKESIKR